jgi:hypothetical protein
VALDPKGLEEAEAFAKDLLGWLGCARDDIAATAQELSSLDLAKDRGSAGEVIARLRPKGFANDIAQILAGALPQDQGGVAKRSHEYASNLVAAAESISTRREGKPASATLASELRETVLTQRAQLARRLGHLTAQTMTSRQQKDLERVPAEQRQKILQSAPSEDEAMKLRDAIAELDGLLDSKEGTKQSDQKLLTVLETATDAIDCLGGAAGVRGLAELVSARLTAIGISEADL